MLFLLLKMGFYCALRLNLQMGKQLSKDYTPNDIISSLFVLICGRCGGLVVSVLDSGSRGRVQALAGPLCCVTVLLSRSINGPGGDSIYKKGRDAR